MGGPLWSVGEICTCGFCPHNGSGVQLSVALPAGGNWRRDSILIVPPMKSFTEKEFITQETTIPTLYRTTRIAPGSATRHVCPARFREAVSVGRRLADATPSEVGGGNSLQPSLYISKVWAQACGIGAQTLSADDAPQLCPETQGTSQIRH